MRNTTRITLFLGTLFFSSAALAHPGHDLSGIGAGLLHPLLGIDHLLAMVAVGLWAAQGGGHRIWLLPATFVAMLTAGAGIALHWPSLPMVETGIAASVLALGLLVSLSLRLPIGLSMLATTIFGLLHGYAHGMELPASAHPASYALGFLTATLALHLSGVTIGVFSRQRALALARGLGVAIMASGAYLLVAA